MKQTDFAICLNRFLADYLVNKRGSTPQTIDSYRYAFIFLLDYYDEVLHISADRITLSVLTYEHLLNFYDWLQTERKNSVSTRNQRQVQIASLNGHLCHIWRPACDLNGGQPRTH